jgi:6-phosphogluconolactonase
VESNRYAQNGLVCKRWTGADALRYRHTTADQTTGEPALLQHSAAHTIHLRTFSIDPGGRLLVAAGILPMAVGEGHTVATLTAGLSVYRIGSDGTLDFVRKYDINTGKRMQFRSGMVTLA